MRSNVGFINYLGAFPGLRYRPGAVRPITKTRHSAYEFGFSKVEVFE
jgi:hypothetical protein